MAIATHRVSVGFSSSRLVKAMFGDPPFLVSFSGLLRRALEAQSRNDLDAEVARLLDQSGGRLTDSVEREIARRHLGF